MSNGFLSQEEIDSLLKGGTDNEVSTKEEFLNDEEKDLLGEVGNISMGSSATVLSTLINQMVDITTPQITVTTFSDLVNSFEAPSIGLEVNYTSGITGGNLFVLKVYDAAIIANLMMGGDGKVDENITVLDEMEQSAVTEAMNQMIGSSATSMATMFSKPIDIGTPIFKSDLMERTKSTAQFEKDDLVSISFRLTIGDFIDSKILQIFTKETAKNIVSIMLGDNTEEISEDTQINNIQNAFQEKEAEIQPNYEYDIPEEPVFSPRQENSNKVKVSTPVFEPLVEEKESKTPKNINLILDVPLDISVVLGRTKKSIKDILNFTTGSLIELDKLAEEPVEILVNGKKVAYGEVVVVDENFGVRITNIISNEERIKTLSK